MLKICEPDVIEAVVAGPSGDERSFTFTCDTEGRERLKSAGHEWWRASLVAACRKAWGEGTLVREPLTYHFTWVPRSA